MNTRHVLMAFAALAILSGLAGAAYNSTVSMVNLTVSPNPVVAGGNATISFQLYNAYQGVLYGASLQPSGSYPILNVSPLAGSVIGPIAQGVNSKRYTYTVQIPNTTPSGVYTITFTAEYFIYAATGTETATTQMPVSFFVNNRPNIKVMAENPHPAALYSGYNQTIDIVVQNTGYGTARNVSVDVTGSKGVDVLSSVHSFLISNLTQNASVSKAILISPSRKSVVSFDFERFMYCVPSNLFCSLEE